MTSQKNNFQNFWVSIQLSGSACENMNYNGENDENRMNID